MSNKNPIQWVLASASKHRAKQLTQAGCQFTLDPSDVDETPIVGEAPAKRAQRLAQAKAVEVAQRHPDSLVIGSDQVAHLSGQLLRKPGHHEAALEQLMQASGQRVSFETALCVIGPSQTPWVEITQTQIEFWPFDQATANRYLKIEKPYDAAGSFYSEAMGQWLIKRHQSEDPSAIVGLPMLSLGRALRALGIRPF